MTTYTNLGADGLPTDGEHQAVRVEHPLLAQPIIVTAFRAPKDMTWKDAQAWAEGLDANGWSWRLPTVDEAAFIPDRMKYPAVDKKHFPDIKDWEWIWTSTPDAEDPSGYAWFVSLRDGYVSRYYQTFRYSVRAVRAGQ